MGGRGYGLAAALAVAAGASGCDDGGGSPVRGFHSRQLVSSRDPTLILNGFGSKIATAQGANGPYSYNATDPDIAYYSTGDPPGKTYWQLRLTDGSVTELGATIPSWRPSGPPEHFDCRFEQTDGNSWSTMFVVDPETRQDLASIDRIVGFGVGGCPRYPDRYLAVVRLDEGDVGRLWTGPFDQLVRAELDLAIDAQVSANWSYEDDPTKWRMTVLAAVGPAPAGRGIYDIDLAQLTSAELIAPALADVTWASGAAPVSATRSDGLALADVAIAYGLTPEGDHYLYRRRMNDGSDVMFAGPLSPPASRELALFPIAGETAPVYAVSSTLATISTWQQSASPGSDTELLLTWDAGNQRLISCPFPSGTLPATISPGNTHLASIASPRGSRYAFAYADALRFDPSPPSGPLVGLSVLGAGSCALLASKDVKTVALADEAVAWIESPQGGGNDTLWVAGAPGDAPRAVGSMSFLDAPIFIAPNTLEVQLGTDVAWLDVRDDPVKLHYVAEHVYGITTTGPRWLVVAYGLNNQDYTGTLGVVDWHTGEKREISRAVAQFTASSFRSTDTPLNVVYLVRGRAASPQDGIWAATLDAADLP